jgi:hypothetical protein
MPTCLNPVTALGPVRLEFADALALYAVWERPTVIVSDGPYGIDGFEGDLPGPEGLALWYTPHVESWTRHALPETTLWFWGTEVGWAAVHPVLIQHGWRYGAFHVWDKGIAHIAGNVNGKTIRGFPVVTEACVRYTRPPQYYRRDTGEACALQDWLRQEWLRTGLPLFKANEACGVRNAATRKYLTRDHCWYFPPPEVMERLAAYANTHGAPAGRPYFSLDGTTLVHAGQWEPMRAKWHHTHGITNVWRSPPVHGQERLKDWRGNTLHANQKPQRLMERIIVASSDAGDVIWEPFGGLCTATLAALRLERKCFSAEINEKYYRLARKRLEHAAMLHELFPE